MRTHRGDGGAGKAALIRVRMNKAKLDCVQERERERLNRVVGVVRLLSRSIGPLSEETREERRPWGSPHTCSIPCIGGTSIFPFVMLYNSGGTSQIPRYTSSQRGWDVTG